MFMAKAPNIDLIMATIFMQTIISYSCNSSSRPKQTIFCLFGINAVKFPDQSLSGQGSNQQFITNNDTRSRIAPTRKNKDECMTENTHHSFCTFLEGCLLYQIRHLVNLPLLPFHSTNSPVQPLYRQGQLAWPYLCPCCSL